MSAVLLTQYKAAVSAGHIQEDAAQLQAIAELDKLLEALNTAPKKSWWSMAKASPVKGLYLWGNVGTGKTYVMDAFFGALTLPKLRLHFHRFMKRVHDELKTLQGESNPVEKLAKRMAKEFQVLCFDEFVVTNIVDAMLLGHLMQALFAQGLVLVATSNIPPDDLYKGGLQREQFLPAIDQIKTYCAILEVDSGKDYRLQKSDVTDVFLAPINEANETRFLQYLNAYGVTPAQGSITLVGRSLATLGQSSSALYLEFKTLCESDRSQLDYIAITEQFEAVFVRGLHAIDKEKHNYISRWISFIDVLYDAHVKLVCLSDVALSAIYSEGEYAKAYERTQSRLYEMQSEGYLGGARK
ncbi:MAG: cell division protein ZapE [Gammaproteobacteria bacterium CG11_big_fil_rev_8_21_14_0_20_46_22]|nr:MAG: cell division protein ZapE [Gammaproteobacteria bacterium CG12_big_fil_rev_8_21_14_0_65_46_12]PIR11416.1 MAG: cell division protein ZapE [Gammaproteobacteria bacterium CG11_big_fil_rev_8_21_14_0_20_46_22]